MEQEMLETISKLIERTKFPRENNLETIVTGKELKVIKDLFDTFVEFKRIDRIMKENHIPRID